MCLLYIIGFGLYFQQECVVCQTKMTQFQEYVWLLRAGTAEKPTLFLDEIQYKPTNRHDGDFGMSLKCLCGIGQTALPPQAGRGVPVKPFDKKKQAPGRRATHHFLRRYCPELGDCAVGSSLRAALSGPWGGSHTMLRLLQWAIHRGLRFPDGNPLTPG